MFPKETDEHRRAPRTELKRTKTYVEEGPEGQAVRSQFYEADHLGLIGFDGSISSLRSSRGHA